MLLAHDSIVLAHGIKGFPFIVSVNLSPTMSEKTHDFLFFLKEVMREGTVNVCVFDLAYWNGRFGQQKITGPLAKYQPVIAWPIEVLVKF